MRDRFNLNYFLEKYAVEIPLIQREYAQGREESKVSSIRESFLKDIVALLVKKSSGLELDFVFGEVVGGVVRPIDGQQRLTTLLLVYWYFNRLPQKWQFSYSGRRMASCFVENLMDERNRHEWANNLNVLPDEWIKSQSWFQPVWLGDATVSGMLRTLRTLHNCVSKYASTSIHPELLNEIVFYFDPLDDVDADEGYRKMNARGKALSDWENIKAIIDDRVCSDDYAGDSERWTSSISGKWLTAMESFLPKKVKDETREAHIKKCVTMCNEGFRNVLDVAVFLTLVRTLEERKIECLEILSNWKKHQDRDLVILEDLFGERAHALNLYPAQGDEETRFRRAIECEEASAWKVLRQKYLEYYEKMFRQHQAYPMDYANCVDCKALDLAMDIFDALVLAPNDFEKDWNRMDRRHSLSDGWRSAYRVKKDDKDGKDELIAGRNKNWFWQRRDRNGCEMDAPLNCDDSLSKECFGFCEDFLFIKSLSSNKQADFSVSTAVRVYIVSRIAQKELTDDALCAVRHFYNLLDNQESISVSALPEVLDFVDDVFNGDNAEQVACFQKNKDRVFTGCPYQMEEELWKAQRNVEGDTVSYLQFEVKYAQLNGNIGFLWKVENDKMLLNQEYERVFDTTVWVKGTLPKSAFFEVLKASTNDTFMASNAAQDKLMLPDGDNSLRSWKANLNRRVWRRVFANYVSCGGTPEQKLPEIQFLVDAVAADKNILNEMAVIWRHGYDARFYLCKTSERLFTYVWLSYTEEARKILDAAGVRYVTSSTATKVPLDRLGFAGYFMDMSKILNEQKHEVYLYQEQDKSIKGFSLPISECDDVKNALKRAIQKDMEYHEAQKRDGGCA